MGRDGIGRLQQRGTPVTPTEGSNVQNDLVSLRVPLLLRKYLKATDIQFFGQALAVQDDLLGILSPILEHFDAGDGQ